MQFNSIQIQFSNPFLGATAALLEQLRSAGAIDASLSAGVVDIVDGRWLHVTLSLGAELEANESALFAWREACDGAELDPTKAAGQPLEGVPPLRETELPALAIPVPEDTLAQPSANADEEEELEDEAGIIADEENDIAESEVIACFWDYSRVVVFP